MKKTHYVNCPFCTGMMEVDAESGKVLGQWDADKSEAGRDKMAQVLKKLEADKAKRKDLFSIKKDELKNHQENLSKSFSENIKKAKEKGPDDRSMNPLDLD